MGKGLTRCSVKHANKPDGQLRRKLDTSRIRQVLPDWKPTWGFDEGLAATYRWFLEERFEKLASGAVPRTGA
jgi:nucleoside-diphosphate-sugar epimerase